MSTELQAITGRTQAEIEQSIRAKTDNLQRILVVGVCDIGLDLTDLKAKCPHGEWGAALRRLGYSSSTANNFMRMYEAYGTQQVSLFGGGNCQTFGNLEYSKALALLAVPAEEREQFAEEVDAEHISVRKLKEEIKAREAERDEARNQAAGWQLKAAQAKEEAEQRQEAAEQKEAENARLAARVQELESRPVEVATVDASQEQLQEAEKRGHEQAMRDAAMEQERVNKKHQQAEESLKKQNQELAQALEAARTEADQYQGTNAELMVQLEAAKKSQPTQAPQEPLVRCKLLFEQLQTTINSMVELLPQVDEVNQAKLRKGLPGVLRKMADQLETPQ